MHAARFNSRMSDIGDNIERRTNQIRKDAAAGMHGELITETPKDTTQAAGNWRVGIGRRASGFIRGATASQARSTGLSAIQGSAPGSRIIISNDAPYIDRLNEGWSRQAPAGFVQAVVSRWRAWVRRQKGLIRGRKP